MARLRRHHVRERLARVPYEGIAAIHHGLADGLCRRAFLENINLLIFGNDCRVLKSKCLSALASASTRGKTYRSASGGHALERFGVEGLLTYEMSAGSGVPEPCDRAAGLRSERRDSRDHLGNAGCSFGLRLRLRLCSGLGRGALVQVVGVVEECALSSIAHLVCKEHARGDSFLCSRHFVRRFGCLGARRAWRGLVGLVLPPSRRTVPFCVVLSSALASLGGRCTRNLASFVRLLFLFFLLLLLFLLLRLGLVVFSRNVGSAWDFVLGVGGEDRGLRLEVVLKLLTVALLPLEVQSDLHLAPKPVRRAPVAANGRHTSLLHLTPEDVAPVQLINKVIEHGGALGKVL